VWLRVRHEESGLPDLVESRDDHTLKIRAVTRGASVFEALNKGSENHKGTKVREHPTVPVLPSCAGAHCGMRGGRKRAKTKRRGQFLCAGRYVGKEIV